MTQDLAHAADAVLDRAVHAEARVAGVVAMVTDRDGAVYQGTAGTRRLGEDDPMTTDTVFAMFSCTKAITATAALQLVEEGRLDLDAPARTYVPEIGERKVLDGFDDDGTPRLRDPKREITTRMLLTHTAGFAYDAFNESYRRLGEEQGQPTAAAATKASLTTPLLFDPGERWEYGTSYDWAGQLVEAITGERLGDVFAARIFGPLGITDTTFELDDQLFRRLAAMHIRGDDGSLTPIDSELPAPPEIQMGGHGLYGTVDDYMSFIRMWLNDGQGDHGVVLKPETVQLAVQNHLGDLKLTMLPGVIPSISHDMEFFPGISKSWSLAFMINDEQAPTGRPAGALGWSGAANTYFWIDRANGYGGFWATQTVPWGDATAFGGYLEFETAVYASLEGSSPQR
jgi:methyl acetate hydrolase